MRAALAYVPNKRKALGEFRRVLRPGGSLSLGEPVLQDEAFFAWALRERIETSAVPVVRFFVLLHRWKSAQFPDTAEACAASPITNYSERNLFSYVREAGFIEIHLQLNIDMTPSLIKSWDVFLGTSPHPWAPSLAQVLAERFTTEERDFFEQTMRPTIEAGNQFTISRTVYLQARKPM
jgi:SAM-dependent methyltransferase